METEITIASLSALMERLQDKLAALQKGNADKKEIAALEQRIAGLAVAIDERRQDLARKSTPLFRSTPGPRSTAAAVEMSPFGRVCRRIAAADPEAAAEWDIRLWRPLR